MLLLAFCILATRFPDGPANADYLAMPKAPVFFDESARPVPRGKIVFHALHLIKVDGRGTLFRLDDGSLVRCRSRSVLGDGTMPRLTSSNELAQLRKRYLGRPVWTFGSWTMARAPFNRDATMGPDGWPTVETNPGEEVRIKAICELQRAPVKCGAFGFRHNSLPIDFSVDESSLEADKLDRIFLFVYADNPRKGLRNRHYTALFNIFLGSWCLPQVFSLKQPDRATRIAIGQYLKTRTSRNIYLAQSHIEAAWVYGWPMEREALSKILTENVWSDKESYSVIFANGKVKSVIRRP